MSDYSDLFLIELRILKRWYFIQISLGRMSGLCRSRGFDAMAHHVRNSLFLGDQKGMFV